MLPTFVAVPSNPWALEAAKWTVNENIACHANYGLWTAGAYTWVPSLSSTSPPKEIIVIHGEDDEVSLLNDDPDQDDHDILPTATYGVLASLFDDIYKDESEAEGEQDNSQEKDYRGARAA